jgi:hypothetical protein
MLTRLSQVLIFRLILPLKDRLKNLKVSKDLLRIRWEWQHKELRVAG